MNSILLPISSTWRFKTKGLRIFDENNALRIVIPKKKNWINIIISLVLGSYLFSKFFIEAKYDNPFPAIVVSLLFIILVINPLIQSVGGSEDVLINNNRFTIKRKLIGIKISPQYKFPLKDVKDLKFVSTISKDWPKYPLKSWIAFFYSPSDSSVDWSSIEDSFSRSSKVSRILFDCGSSTYRFGVGLKDEELIHIANLIIQHFPTLKEAKANQGQS